MSGAARLAALPPPEAPPVSRSGRAGLRYAPRARCPTATLPLRGKSSRKIAGPGSGSAAASAQLPRSDFGVRRGRHEGGGPVWAPPATRSPGPVAQSVKVPLSAARMCPEFLLIRDQRAGPGEVRIQMAAGLPPTIRHASDWLAMRCYRAQPYSNFYSFSSERFSPPPSFLSNARRLAFSFQTAFDSGAQ